MKAFMKEKLLIFRSHKFYSERYACTKVYNTHVPKILNDLVYLMTVDKIEPGAPERIHTMRVKIYNIV